MIFTLQPTFFHSIRRASTALMVRSTFDGIWKRHESNILKLFLDLNGC